MTGGRGFGQRGQSVQGPQTNIGEAKGQVFSGNITYNEAAKIRLPLQKPPRIQHFVGREDELSSLLNDLQPSRVVTICGPGGMGKTALAAEAVWQLSPGNEPPKCFPDGIVFHTFYHKPQAALALEAIARAYGEDPRQNPLEAAKRALSARQALIILDGTEACEDLGEVLSVTASCAVLITTRRRSDAPTELRDLLPLPLDKATSLLQAWAEELASDEDICRRICSLLGCLPLAIFLVGRYLAHRRQMASEYLSWLEKTPLKALDLGERQHQSIPLLMEHSLEQVSDQACACLGLAGVLAQKPFPPEIIAASLTISPEDANNALGELVEFGLLMRPKVSYQITHALAHTYARSELAPESSALSRLAEYFDDFIGKQTPKGPAGYKRLDSGRDHILAVQAACHKAELWEDVRTLTWAIRDYLHLQGHWVEEVAVLQTGLAAARSAEAHYDEASFLTILGLACAALGEAHKAIDYYEQALPIFRKMGKRQGEGAVLGNLGLAYADLGETRKAIEYYEQQLAIGLEIGDRRSEGNALGNLGIAYKNLGETRKAIEYYEQQLAIVREIGDRRGEGNALGNLGNAYADLGETRKAIDYYEQALAIDREIGDRRGEGTDLGNLGIAYKNLGETRKAIDYYEKALAIARKIGDRRGEGNALWNMSLAREKLDDRARAIECAKAALKIREEIEDPNAEMVKRTLQEWSPQ